jgi:hypothetical protein
MARAVRSKAAARPAPEAANDDAPRVAVVGGGLAGMTAALRLAERGFRVTLYEATDALGGNLSAEKVNGVFHDVYPHMFCDWYANFWSLFENDLARSRDEQFEPRMGVKLKGLGEVGYKTLKSATTPSGIFDNLKSGVASAPDLFLLGFSGLDLASYPFNRHGADQLDRLDVNGFIHSRGYATERIAELTDYILTVIWSIPSDLTAAAAYQDFVKHGFAFPRETPFAWLAKADIVKTVIAPFEEKLARLGCDIRKGCPIAQVALVNGVPELRLQVKDARGRQRPPVAAPRTDYVVLATSAPALAQLALDGAPGERLVDAIPELSQLQRFRNIAIPVANVYFKGKLPDIPNEQVGFVDCDMDLSMLDISQLWSGEPHLKDRTVLVLAASDGFALPSSNPLEQGHMMIRQLHEYLPVFKPGAHWGDPEADVDWTFTHFRSNQDKRLFMNDVGSWEWRPSASHEATPTLFLAGDFCTTDVAMATVESAIQSGLMAARDLQAAHAARTGRPSGEPITIVEHDLYSNGMLLAAKLALLPFAYSATAWSLLTDGRQQSELALPKDAYAPASYAMVLPMAFALDWWKTVYWLIKNFIPSPPGLGDMSGDHIERLPGEPALAPPNPPTPGGPAAHALAAAGDALHALAARLPSRGETNSKLGAALQTFTDQAWRTAGAVAGMLPSLRPEPSGYRRRWRIKP